MTTHLYVREHSDTSWSWHFTINEVRVCSSSMRFYSQTAAISNWADTAKRMQEHEKLRRTPIYKDHG